LLERGRVDLDQGAMLTFAQVKEILGLDQVLGWRERLTH
jgi:hypothetical protein